MNIDDVERSCYPKTHVFDEFVEDVHGQPCHVESLMTLLEGVY